ncbi:MAG: hypothetical protein EBR82_34670 [Caulobacteraceae bacterium]|nr:hypothetical protein [Caulobacteraceae bacterium]
MALTREQIESSSARVAPVEAFGGECFVRVMSVGDRDAYEVLVIEHGGKIFPDFRSELVSRTLCDEKGKLLYPGSDGIEAIKQLPSDHVHKVWTAAMKHNAMTEEEIRKLAGE